MSILSDLKAALEAKREAEALMITTPTDGNVGGIEYRRWKHREQHENARWKLRDLLTDDTLASLIAVAEAADVFIVCNEGGEPISWLDIKAALAPLVKEADCPTCHGHGGGGFDRNGSHTEGRYCEYPCPTCGKEADHE